MSQENEDLGSVSKSPERISLSTRHRMNKMSGDGKGSDETLNTVPASPQPSRIPRGTKRTHKASETRSPKPQPRFKSSPNLREETRRPSEPLPFKPPIRYKSKSQEDILGGRRKDKKLIIIKSIDDVEKYFLSDYVKPFLELYEKRKQQEGKALESLVTGTVNLYGSTNAEQYNNPFDLELTSDEDELTDDEDFHNTRREKRTSLPVGLHSLVKGSGAVAGSPPVGSRIYRSNSGLLEKLQFSSGLSSPIGRSVDSDISLVGTDTADTSKSKCQTDDDMTFRNASNTETSEKNSNKKRNLNTEESSREVGSDTARVNMSHPIDIPLKVDYSNTMGSITKNREKVAIMDAMTPLNVEDMIILLDGTVAEKSDGITIPDMKKMAKDSLDKSHKDVTALINENLDNIIIDLDVAPSVERGESSDLQPKTDNDVMIEKSAEFKNKNYSQEKERSNNIIIVPELTEAPTLKVKPREFVDQSVHLIKETEEKKINDIADEEFSKNTCSGETKWYIQSDKKEEKQSKKEDSLKPVDNFRELLEKIPQDNKPLITTDWNSQATHVGGSGNILEPISLESIAMPEVAMDSKITETTFIDKRKGQRCAGIGSDSSSEIDSDFFEAENMKSGFYDVQNAYETDVSEYKSLEPEDSSDVDNSNVLLVSVASKGDDDSQILSINRIIINQTLDNEHSSAVAPAGHLSSPHLVRHNDFLNKKTGKEINAPGKIMGTVSEADPAENEKQWKLDMPESMSGESLTDNKILMDTNSIQKNNSNDSKAKASILITDENVIPKSSYMKMSEKHKKGEQSEDVVERERLKLDSNVVYKLDMPEKMAKEKIDVNLKASVLSGVSDHGGSRMNETIEKSSCTGQLNKMTNIKKENPGKTTAAQSKPKMKIDDKFDFPQNYEQQHPKSDKQISEELKTVISSIEYEKETNNQEKNNNSFDFGLKTLNGDEIKGKIRKEQSGCALSHENSGAVGAPKSEKVLNTELSTSNYKLDLPQKMGKSYLLDMPHVMTQDKTLSGMETSLVNSMNETTSIDKNAQMKVKQDERSEEAAKHCLDKKPAIVKSKSISSKSEKKKNENKDSDTLKALFEDLLKLKKKEEEKGSTIQQLVKASAFETSLNDSDQNKLNKLKVSSGELSTSDNITMLEPNIQSNADGVNDKEKKISSNEVDNDETTTKETENIESASGEIAIPDINAQQNIESHSIKPGHDHTIITGSQRDNFIKEVFVSVESSHSEDVCHNNSVSTIIVNNGKTDNTVTIDTSGGSLEKAESSSEGDKFTVSSNIVISREVKNKKNIPDESSKPTLISRFQSIFRNRGGKTEQKQLIETVKVEKQTIIDNRPRLTSIEYTNLDDKQEVKDGEGHGHVEPQLDFKIEKLELTPGDVASISMPNGVIKDEIVNTKDKGKDNQTMSHNTASKVTTNLSSAYLEDLSDCLLKGQKKSDNSAKSETDTNEVKIGGEDVAKERHDTMKQVDKHSYCDPDPAIIKKSREVIRELNEKLERKASNKDSSDGEEVADMMTDNIEHVDVRVCAEKGVNYLNKNRKNVKEISENNEIKVIESQLKVKSVQHNENIDPKLIGTHYKTLDEEVKLRVDEVIAKVREENSVEVTNSAGSVADIIGKLNKNPVPQSPITYSAVYKKSPYKEEMPSNETFTERNHVDSPHKELTNISKPSNINEVPQTHELSEISTVSSNTVSCIRSVLEKKATYSYGEKLKTLPSNNDLGNQKTSLSTQGSEVAADRQLFVSPSPHRKLSPSTAYPKQFTTSLASHQPFSPQQITQEKDYTQRADTYNGSLTQTLTTCPVTPQASKKTCRSVKRESRWKSNSSVKPPRGKNINQIQQQYFEAIREDETRPLQKKDPASEIHAALLEKAQSMDDLATSINSVDTSISWSQEKFRNVVSLRSPEGDKSVTSLYKSLESLRSASNMGSRTSSLASFPAIWIEGDDYYYLKDVQAEMIPDVKVKEIAKVFEKEDKAKRQPTRGTSKWSHERAISPAVSPITSPPISPRDQVRKKPAKPVRDLGDILTRASTIEIIHGPPPTSKELTRFEGPSLKSAIQKISPLIDCSSKAPAEISSPSSSTHILYTLAPNSRAQNCKEPNSSNQCVRPSGDHAKYIQQESEQGLLKGIRNKGLLMSKITSTEEKINAFTKELKAIEEEHSRAGMNKRSLDQLSSKIDALTEKILITKSTRDDLLANLHALEREESTK